MRGHVGLVTRGHGERQGSRGDRNRERCCGFMTPANYPVSGFPLLLGITIRQPLTANRHHLPLKLRQQLRRGAGLRADEGGDVDGALMDAGQVFAAE